MNHTIKFKSNRKGYIKGMLAASLILPLVIFLLNKEHFSENPAMILPTLIPMGIFLWIYFGTHYSIRDNKLFYKSAFIWGQIDISKIYEIIKGKTAWTGMRPATATKGLLIKFHAYNEIYVSPESNDSLIEALKLINDKIKVTE